MYLEYNTKTFHTSCILVPLWFYSNVFLGQLKGLGKEMRCKTFFSIQIMANKSLFILLIFGCIIYSCITTRNNDLTDMRSSLKEAQLGQRPFFYKD